MQNSKLIKLVQSLTYKELKKFDDYLDSAFVNKNPLLIKFFDLLKNDYPKFSSDKILPEKLFETMFPEEKYDAQKMRYLMTDLVRLLEDYLSDLQFNKNPFTKKFQLLVSFNQRNLDKYFHSTKEIVRNIQDKHPYRDAEFFYNEYLLEAESNLYFSKHANRTNDNSLYSALDNLDFFYLATKLKYCCEVMNRKNVLAVDYELLFLDEMLMYLKKNSNNLHPVVAIYYQILMTLKESDDETHFSKLKELLNQHIDKFNVHEARDMYAFVQNYCIKKINKGNTEYLNELFLMYKTLLKKGIFMVDDYINPWDFKNIVVVGLRLKDFEWTEKFIHEYKSDVAPNFRDNSFNYNLAALYFNKQEYSKALKLLQKVDYTDVYYHLDSKSLLLKTYYELGEIEPLLSLIDAFRIFLRRNKLISEYQRTVYSNQVKFVKKAMNIKLKPINNDSVSNLKNDIETTKQVADIKWLLQKVNELEIKN